MAEMKNNHYIPRFYLRNFTDDPSTKNGNFDYINLKSSKHIGNIPHGSQMKGEYFYEKGSDIEIELGSIFERKHACVIKNVLDEQKEFNPVELLEIVLLMHFRTRAQRDEDLFFRKNLIDQHLIDNMTSGFKTYLKNKLPKIVGMLNDSDLEKVVKNERIKDKMRDLNVVILSNPSKLNLMSSDRPVLLLNPFLNRKKVDFGKDGMFQMGILLILPISPQKIIVCYDPIIYQNPFKLNAGILTEIDVENLNKLQVLCGVDGVYSKMLPTGFSQTVFDILSSKLIPKLITVYLPGGYELTYKDDCLPGMEFSFLKERDGVNDIKLNIPYSRK